MGKKHKFAGYGVDATTDDAFDAYGEQENVQAVAGKKGKSKSSSKSKSKGKGKKKSSSKKKKKSSSKSKSKKKSKSKSSSKKKHKFAGYGVDATTDDAFDAYGEQENIQAVAGKKGKSKSSS